MNTSSSSCFGPFFPRREGRKEHLDSLVLLKNEIEISYHVHQEGFAKQDTIKDGATKGNPLYSYLE